MDSLVRAPRLFLLLVCYSALTPSCSTFELPSTAPADIATIVAATQRAAPTSTPSPIMSRTPTAAPTPTSTPVPGTPAAPTRIPMLHGATSASINAHIGAGESQAYVVRGLQGQPMLVRLVSAGGDASLFMMSQGGTYFLRPGIDTSWQGSLPQTGSYYLGIYGGAQPSDYTLAVQLATRIRFKEGDPITTVSGRIPAGTIATYSVYGIKGKKIYITLSGAGTRAALSVTGFIDGKSYLAASARKSSFRGTIPATQDYLLEIIPRTGETVGYILDVEIEIE